MLVLQQPECSQGTRDDQELAARRKSHPTRDALEVAPRDGRCDRDVFDRLKSPRRREERVDGADDRRRQRAELPVDNGKEALGERIHRDAHGERSRSGRLVFDAGNEQASRAARQELGGECDARGGERRIEQDRNRGVALEQRGERARAVLEAAVARVEHDEVHVAALERLRDAIVVVDARCGDDGFIGAECGA